MLRQANAVDFWRGFALATIFINHIPGIFYSRFTHAKLSLSDSAEIFVFLAGWALRYTTRSRQGQPIHLALPVGRAAIELQSAPNGNPVVPIRALAPDRATPSKPANPRMAPRGALFQEPVQTHLGLALLSFQLDFFNILPLYVIL